MTPCPTCGTHTRIDDSTCPHCGGRMSTSRGPSLAIALLGLAVSGGCIGTSQAIYGAPVTDTDVTDTDTDTDTDDTSDTGT